MPKTRNISRSQWSAAHSAIASNTTTSAKRRNSNALKEDEKENMGRSATQTRTHRRGSSLGVSNPTAAAANPRGSATKVAKKGKAKISQVKEKKLPLQDITSQFLPAPESANRGAGLTRDDLGGSTLPPVVESPPRHVVVSPLPPSSPPSEPFSPVQLKHPVFDKWFDGMEKNQDGYDPLQDFGEPTTGVAALEPEGHSVSSQTSSDPFGFTTVERKLKQEREIAAAIANPFEEIEDDFYEDLDDIPVADTSSPRPVGLRRSRSSFEQQDFLSETEKSNTKEVDERQDLAVTSGPHLHVPPTPHKDKEKRPRLSHGGHNIFSPCTSSVESSPSPTKTSASKRRRPVQTDPDPLEEFNEEFEKSWGPDAIVDKLPPLKRHCQSHVVSDRDEEVVGRNLRPRRTKQEVSEEKAIVPQKRKKPSSVKDKLTKKPASKPHSSRKIAVKDDEDDEEKLQREREERIKYFERLSEYEVEKENVYII